MERSKLTRAIRAGIQASEASGHRWPRAHLAGALARARSGDIAGAHRAIAAARRSTPAGSLTALAIDTIAHSLPLTRADYPVRTLAGVHGLTITG